MHRPMQSRRPNKGWGGWGWRNPETQAINGFGAWGWGRSIGHSQTRPPPETRTAPIRYDRPH